MEKGKKKTTTTTCARNYSKIPFDEQIWLSAAWINADLGNLQLPGGWNWSCSNNLWVIIHIWEMNNSVKCMHNTQHRLNSWIVFAQQDSKIHRRVIPTLLECEISHLVFFLENNWSEFFGFSVYSWLLLQRRVFFRWWVCRPDTLSTACVTRERQKAAGQKDFWQRCRAVVQNLNEFWPSRWFGRVLALHCWWCRGRKTKIFSTTGLFPMFPLQ